jgi:colanic acid/amylovoran biosynthesis glycosyltransferase
MLKVAHLIPTYLEQSLTFIWQYLSKLKHSVPIVVTRSLKNLDQFPLKRGQFIEIHGPQLTIPWILDNFYRRMLGRPMGYAEQLLLKKQTQLIHAHFGPSGCDAIEMTSLNMPRITSFYGFDLSKFDVIQQRKHKYNKLFREGERFLVEGPSLRDKLIALGCPEEKTSIQRIAIDLENYIFDLRPKNETEIVRFLFVGRFVEKKGLEYAFRALANINKGFAYEFRIIGYGHLEEKLRLLAVNLGINDKIKWLGIQPHLHVLKELSTCDILLQPSIVAKNGDSEGGAPTIIIEAQACGVPVVSTFHADIPYVTAPEESALLSEEKNVDQLTENIKILVNNRSLWPKMGKAGRNHVEKYHDIKKEVVSLENIYKSFF